MKFTAAELKLIHALLVEECEALETILAEEGEDPAFREDLDTALSALAKIEA